MSCAQEREEDRVRVKVGFMVGNKIGRGGERWDGGNEWDGWDDDQRMSTSGEEWGYLCLGWQWEMRCGIISSSGIRVGSMDDESPRPPARGRSNRFNYISGLSVKAMYAPRPVRRRTRA